MFHSSRKHATAKIASIHQCDSGKSEKRKSDDENDAAMAEARGGLRDSVFDEKRKRRQKIWIFGRHSPSRFLLGSGAPPVRLLAGRLGRLQYRQPDDVGSPIPAHHLARSLRPPSGLSGP